MKRLVVLGAGESGVGAAILAKEKNFSVFVSDYGTIASKYKQILQTEAIEWEEKKHSTEEILNADEVVKSPGIPDSAAIVLKLKEKKIPVISEIEFAARYTNAKKIAITGSNGKTTTTMLIYEMLKKAGLKVGIAGNIGKSFALQVARETNDAYVLEISSFQLDGMYAFKADIGILMNITPDHLDRYNNNFEEYTDSKFRIAQNMQHTENLILCKDDNIIQHNKEKRELEQQTNVLEFGIDNNAHAHIQNSTITINANGRTLTMNQEELSLKGKHNSYNSMAAAITGLLMNLKDAQIRESLQTFHSVEHRLEEVLSIRNILFVNDSKATNINSTWYALESMTKPTILILGGVDKGNDYQELYELTKEKVKAIVALGTDNKKIEKAFAPITNVHSASSMKEAVQSAYYLAKKGDCVLLSPACASFDLFSNYEDRGKQFKEHVKAL